MIEKITKRKSTFTIAEGGRRPLLNLCQRKSAFTLAEVLITLVVIGIVAALTLPGLIQNHNEKAWSTAQSVFEKRLEVATKQMNTEEKLAGYANTIDFVNELKKYIKITKVCDSNDLTKCFESKILAADGQEIEVSNLKSSSQLAKEDWGTETIGVQFADGVGALIAYNPPLFHMYNFITNDWKDAPHQLTYDVRQPKTQKYVKEKLKREIVTL